MRVHLVLVQTSVWDDKHVNVQLPCDSGVGWEHAEL
jgi:hypothetical protein